MANKEQIENQKELNRLKREQAELDKQSNEALLYARDAFKNIVFELKGGNDQEKIANQLQKSRISSLTKASSIAGQLLEVAKGETVLSKKQLDNLKIRNARERANLENIQKNTKAGSIRFNQIQSEIDALDEVAGKQEDIENVINSTNKALGFAPSLAGGFDKALQKAGFPALGIAEAIEDTHKEAQAATGKFDAMGEFAKKLTANIKSAASFTNILQLTLGLVVERMLEINAIQTDFRRLTGGSAEGVGYVNDALITTSDQLKTMVSLTEMFGFNANMAFDAINIQEATELTELMGLSAEEAGNLAFFAQASGTNLKEAASNIYDGVSAGISQKKILQDIGKVSNAVALTFGGNLEAMGRTADEAKKLGLNLQQVDDIASGLLDIESSIAAEFQAEVISGKQLNLERARFFALTNDLEGLTKEIGKNQEIIDSFASGNRIEQEATAEALNLSREAMAKMIFDQAIVEGLTTKEAAARSDMGIEDAKRLRVQESLNKSISRMTELLAGPLEALVGMVDLAVKFGDALLVGAATFQIINARAAIYKGIQTATAIFQKKNLMSSIVEMATRAFSSVARIPFIGTVLGAAAAASAYALGKSYFSKADDLMSGYGQRTLLAPEGTFALNNNDTVIAGTNLGGGRGGRNQGLSKEDVSAIATAVRDGASSAQINLDGGRVSNRIQPPLAMNTRKYSV